MSGTGTARGSQPSQDAPALLAATGATWPPRRRTACPWRRASLPVHTAPGPDHSRRDYPASETRPASNPSPPSAISGRFAPTLGIPIRDPQLWRIVKRACRFQGFSRASAGANYLILRSGRTDDARSCPKIAQFLTWANNRCRSLGRQSGQSWWRRDQGTGAALRIPSQVSRNPLDSEAEAVPPAHGPGQKARNAGSGEAAGRPKRIVRRRAGRASGHAQRPDGPLRRLKLWEPIRGQDPPQDGNIRPSGPISARFPYWE